MRWIIRLYSFALLAYTGWRTFDFMRAQLPGDMTGQALAILFLFTTEAGLLLWHEVSLKHTTTETQHYTAIFMTWLDFVASLGAGIADMILRATFTQGFTIPPLLSALLVYGLPIATALNVASVLVYLSNDADTVLETQKRRLRFVIYKKALRDVQDSTGQVADQLRKTIAKEVIDDVTLNTFRKQITLAIKEAGKESVTIKPINSNASNNSNTVSPIRNEEVTANAIPLPHPPTNGNGHH